MVLGLLICTAGMSSIFPRNLFAMSSLAHCCQSLKQIGFARRCMHTYQGKREHFSETSSTDVISQLI